MINRKILISGAGIAGPALAYWLLRHGFEPAMVEQAPALREGGYIIDLWGIGFDVAEKMGLLPALRTGGYRFDEIRFVNARGERVGGFNMRLFQATLGERYLSVLRSDLSRHIYESLGGEVQTIFGDWITAIEDDEDGARVIFKHAAPQRFDLVIGAGGLHSGVRKLVFGPEGCFEKSLGYYTASFGVAGYPRRDANTYVSYCAPRRLLSRYALRGDRSVFFLVFAPKTRLQVGQHDTLAQKKVLRDVFGQDGWECPAILEALDACSNLYFDAVSQIRMDTWSRGRVTLLGDSCFCPSLLAGEGAALAMAGAYILAGELKKARGDHAAAFRNYEDFFRPFIARKQRAAEHFAGSFAPKTSLGLFIRNRITRLMAIPPVANLTMGRMLFDRISLPLYDAT